MICSVRYVIRYCRANYTIICTQCLIMACVNIFNIQVYVFVTLFAQQRQFLYILYYLTNTFYKPHVLCINCVNTMF